MTVVEVKLPFFEDETCWLGRWYCGTYRGRWGTDILPLVGLAATNESRMHLKQMSYSFMDRPVSDCDGLVGSCSSSWRDS